MTINCQVCGTPNPDSNKYCDGCGVELTNNAPTSEVTPPDAAVSVPTPDGDLTNSTAARPPVTPLTPPETIGSGTAPNPYQTPLSETMIGQLDSGSAAPLESAPLPETTAGTPVSSEPEATANDQATSAPTDAPASVPAPADAAPAETTPAPDTATESPVIATPVSTAAAPTGTGGAAKLGLKKFGQPTGDFIPLQGEKLVVGRFDASSGPVDIDLGEMAGKEHISRHHAELYVENGTWHVRDLGSTNGVFLKKKGEGSFSPRLQEPAALADGDELAFGNVMLTFNQG